MMTKILGAVEALPQPSQEASVLDVVAETAAELHLRDIVAYEEFKRQLLHLFTHIEEAVPQEVRQIDVLPPSAYRDERTDAEIEEVRQRIFASAKRARSLPPGKTLEEVIVGALSEDKSEQDIKEALAELR
jgi:hypothetical protein